MIQIFTVFLVLVGYAGRLCFYNLEETAVPIQPYFLSNFDKTRIGFCYRSGESMRRIGKRFGCGSYVISRVLQEIGIEKRYLNRKYHAREDAFDNAAADPAAAYWCGFLLTDGYVDNGYGKYTISLTLAARDQQHVRLFSQFLGITNYPLEIEDNHGYSKQSKAVTLTIGNKRLFQALQRYGIVPRKSLIAKVKLLENNLHFWRGAIDGDGFISFKKTGCPLIGLTSASKEFTEQFVRFIEPIVDRKFPKLYTYQQGTNTRMWYIHVGGDRAVKLIAFLYKDHEPVLERKALAAETALQWQNPGSVHRGSTNGFSKLDEAQVRWIRLKLHYGIHGRDLAEQYGVSESLISAIRKGKIWTHI